MREIVAKGDLAVFIQVDDLDKTFESLRAAGTEILQEPVDQPYGVRDAAVRDPSGNHLRLSQPLAAQAEVRVPANPTRRSTGNDMVAEREHRLRHS
jgi:hypothetical protein